MASNSDVFSKLSRILETHNFSDDDREYEDFLGQFVSENMGTDEGNNTYNTKRIDGSQVSELAGDRPTPYQVWKSKQKNLSKHKETPKLSGEEWDHLVDHLHKSNKLKESAVMKEQNQGLALELGGYQFKPRMNSKSSTMVATMKSLNERIPQMLATRKEQLTRRRLEMSKREMAECTFTPSREGCVASDKYLKKLGRSGTSKKPQAANPKVFFEFQEEKKRRNAVRKQIIDEIDSRELTFKPSLNSKSQLMQSRLLNKAKMAQSMTAGNTVGIVDTPIKSQSDWSAKTPQQPFSSMTLAAKRLRDVQTAPASGTIDAGSGFDPTSGDYYGAPTVIQSKHPYKNNDCQYTTVAVPGAISYVIKFDEKSSTVAIHDYIKFYTDDRHVEYWGCGKYSGGAGKSNCNWPGVGGRAELVIPANRFVICFKSSHSKQSAAAGGCWGFRLSASPVISGNPEHHRQQAHEYTPQLSDLTRRMFGQGETAGNSVNLTAKAPSANMAHVRLHEEAKKKAAGQRQRDAELYETKLNIPLKHWEKNAVREGQGSQISNSSHFNVVGGGDQILKAQLMDLIITAPDVDHHRTQGGEHKTSPHVLLEYNDSLATIWRDLFTAEAVNGGGSTYDANAGQYDSYSQFQEQEI